MEAFVGADGGLWLVACGAERVDVDVGLVSFQVATPSRRYQTPGVKLGTIKKLPTLPSFRAKDFKPKCVRACGDGLG